MSDDVKIISETEDFPSSMSPERQELSREISSKLLPALLQSSQFDALMMAMMRDTDLMNNPERLTTSNAEGLVVSKVDGKAYRMRITIDMAAAPDMTASDFMEKAVVQQGGSRA